MNDKSTEKYKCLWVAVLSQAVEDLSSKDRLTHDETVEWFAKTEDIGIGCFLWVCSVLGLDPEETRRRINGNL